MKAQHVGLFSSLGMLLVGGAVYAVTPAGGFKAGKVTDSPSAEAGPGESDTGESAGRATTSSSDDLGPTFQVGGAVKIEGRLGNKALQASDPNETFLMLELRGDEKANGAPPPVALSIVIDKSGSMRQGTRLANALQAAVTAVERLHDGDAITVVAFDTRTELVVPLTTVSASSRASVLQSIRSIQLGGDTCVSCGIESGLEELKKAQSGAAAPVSRMIVLSDGDTNNGIRDVPGFRSLAGRAMAQGVSITTIGVDLEFNEKIMSAIAQGSNGRHYFVENDRDLTRVFDAEAATLTESVASGVNAEIDLGPGVELVRVFDRTFTRNGSRISVPLGSLSKGEVKTVLVKVRVPKGEAGTLSIASIDVGYRDLVTDKDTALKGKLALELVSDKAEVGELDALVADRLQRSETAAALRDANSLFSLGKADEARERLRKQSESVANERAKSQKKAPAGRAKDIDQSFQAQETELNRSLENFATPPPADAPLPAGQPQAAPPKPKAQIKRNVEQADAFSL